MALNQPRRLQRDPTKRHDDVRLHKIDLHLQPA